LAKEIRKDKTIDNHKLAQQLWDSGIHEARILASMIDDSELVTEKQMNSWVKDFDSWDTCDQICMNLFDKTPQAYKKVGDWAKNEREFVRRSGFTMIASLACHDKNAEDKKFINFLSLIKKYSTDERNFVKKAVNWALRGIGKRNKKLNLSAIQTAKEIQKINNKTAKWIALDAIRELEDKKIQKRLR